MKTEVTIHVAEVAAMKVVAVLNHNRDLIKQLEELVVDLVVPMEDQGIMVLEAVDLTIAPKEVVRVKTNEAAESIDILKDRQFQ